MRRIRFCGSVEIQRPAGAQLAGACGKRRQARAEQSGFVAGLLRGELGPYSHADVRLFAAVIVLTKPNSPIAYLGGTRQRVSR